MYDDLFNKIKILDNISPSIFNDYFKIDENIFVYSTELKNNIYIATIENYELNKFVIRNGGYSFINFFKKKKILISYDKENLYLINFNSLFPEVIQKIQINDIKSKSIYFTYLEKSIFFLYFLI